MNTHLTRATFISYAVYLAIARFRRDHTARGAKTGAEKDNIRYERPPRDLSICKVPKNRKSELLSWGSIHLTPVTQNLQANLQPNK